MKLSGHVPKPPKLSRGSVRCVHVQYQINVSYKEDFVVSVVRGRRKRDTLDMKTDSGWILLDV